MTDAIGFAAEQFLREVLNAQYVRVRGDEVNHKCFLAEHEYDYKDPGASLNTEKLLWNCWKCSSGGTLLWITEEVLQIKSNKARPLLKQYFDSPEIHEETFIQNLESMWAKSPIETMPRYNIRVMIEPRMCYTKLMDERGITREVQKRMMTGLNRTNTDEVMMDDGSVMQVVQPRIIIPHVFSGVLRGWSMRKIDDRQVGPKYKHTGQFPKKTTLYNFDNARKFDSLIVVESPFSALSLMSKGYDNVVATFGAEVNPGQEALLRKFHEVILFPDGDRAGYRALSREDKDGNITGLAHTLPGSKTTVWIVDHGQMDEYPYWNDQDAADYSADEIAVMLEDKVPALTWDYVSRYEREPLRTVDADEQWD